MITPLRLGFLVSGLLHVAVVTAFSLSSEREIPAVDEPRSLTLRLAVFEPVQSAPSPPLPIEENESQPEVSVLSPPPEPPEQTEKKQPPPEIQPKPAVQRAAPESKPVVKQASARKPVTKKPIKPRRENPQRKSKKPAQSPPVNRPSVTLAAVPKPQPVRAEVDTQMKQHYLAALAAKINRNKYYPLSSRRRGEEGKVVVRFVVQKNGELTELSIVESSGSRRLDAAALKTLRRVSPFRPIPETLGRDNWSISVPIAFSLRG